MWSVADEQEDETDAVSTGMGCAKIRAVEAGRGKVEVEPEPMEGATGTEAAEGRDCLGKMDKSWAAAEVATGAQACPTRPVRSSGRVLCISEDEVVVQTCKDFVH